VIAYAARHPERWNALIPAVRVGWGEDNPAYRKIFTRLFMPDGDEPATARPRKASSPSPLWKLLGMTPGRSGDFSQSHGGRGGAIRRNSS